ncbi:hypothetical protein ACP4OV_000852 [Aristida adscensionis]
MEQGGSKTKLLVTIKVSRCAFVGGDEHGGFTGEQLRFPCKLRRHICARCGMHRGEHLRAGGKPAIREELLPPRKRAAFRRPFQAPAAAATAAAGGGGGGGGKEEKKMELEEGEIWTGDAITKRKRGPRRKRAEAL